MYSFVAESAKSTRWQDTIRVDEQWESMLYLTDLGDEREGTLRTVPRGRTGDNHL